MSTFSNNITNENGEQFIPPSQRPDGTWRKARRVKDGYVPQEEVPLYESKGKQCSSKKPEPIMLSTGQVAQRPIPGLYIIQDDSEKKPSKKKNKKNVEDLSNRLDNVKIVDTAKFTEVKSTKKSEKKTQSVAEYNKIAEPTDPQKKLKNLKKRLREIEALEEKLKSGAVTKPEPEQLAKIERKNDLLLQIHELEKQIL